MDVELTRIAIGGNDVPVAVDVARGRFEVAIGGDVAYIAIRLLDRVLSLIHTDVPQALRGKGVGEGLAHAALEWARDERLLLEPFCPFVAAYLRRHPEYAALIAPWCEDATLAGIRLAGKE